MKIVGIAATSTMDPKKMETGMVSSLDNNDAIIIYDVPAGAYAKISWTNLRKAIEGHFNGRLAAGSVLDEVKTGFAATIPELEDDTVLLTEQDMPRIVKAVKDELAVWDGGSY